MQIKYLHKNIYKLYRWSRTAEEMDKYREKYENGVKKWEKLKKEKVSKEALQEFSGISRATYFRHKNALESLAIGIIPPSKKPKNVRKKQWTEEQIKIILQIRTENPTYGKLKIKVILERDFKVILGVSTVNRILNYLKSKKKISQSLSAGKKKRPRVFKKHAKPWTYKDYTQIIMGERMQLDHMTVSKNGKTFKEFHAWDRPSKFVYSNVYSKANSSSAKRFLLELLEKAPFKILSIQVDGGSEFMKDFEDACESLGIPLIVLPPKKPTYNGGVERSNRIFREEVYAKIDFYADTITEIRVELAKEVEKYNTYRPHQGLNGLTPMEYIENTLSAEAF